MLLCKKESSCTCAWNAGNVLEVIMTTPVGKEFHSLIVLGH